jgi:hypothetical protein
MAKIDNRIPQFVANLKDIVASGLAAAAELAADKMARNVGSENNPSLPGQFPGIVTGGAGLRGGFGSQKNSDGSAGVTSSVEYLRPLEFGTVNKDGSVRMLPRPIVRRTMTESRDDINEAFSKEVRKQSQPYLNAKAQ